MESTEDIEGLPPHIEIVDPEVEQYLNNPRYKLLAEPTRDGDYLLHIMPSNTKDLATFDNKGFRGTTVRLHYDPTKSQLAPYFDEPELDSMGRKKAVLDPGFTKEIEPLTGDVMYRGISAEEWRAIQQTGEVRSLGSGNIGTAQQGLTYWSTQVQSAQFYAHAFAMMHQKAAPGFPAYVIAAPLSRDVRHVEGVASHEVGVVGGVPLDDLLAVWEGKVWSYTPSSLYLRPNWDMTWKSSGGAAPDAQLEWKRIL